MSSYDSALEASLRKRLDTEYQAKMEQVAQGFPRCVSFGFDGRQTGERVLVPDF